MEINQGELTRVHVSIQSTLSEIRKLFFLLEVGTQIESLNSDSISSTEKPGESAIESPDVIEVERKRLLDKDSKLTVEERMLMD